MEQRQRVAPRRQFDPQDVAARRVGHPRAARKALGDQSACLVHPGGDRGAQLAVGGFAARLGQQVGHRQLQQLRVPARMHGFQAADLRPPAPRLDPAQPDARRHRLRERAADHHVARGVEGLDGAAAVVLLGEVVVEHVLDQRNAALGHHLRQPLALGQRHRRADRVGERRHRQHRLDRLRVEGELQRVQRQPGARMRGDLQRAQVHALQDFEEAEVRRRLQRHHVARLRHGAQAQADRLQATVGDQQLARVELAAQAHRVAGDGAAQLLVAGADRVLAQRRAVALRGAADGAAHAVLREQLAARAGGAEGEEARVGGELHHLGAERADVDRLRIGRRARRFRLGRAGRTGGDEVARARAGLDQPGVFERAVGLHDGGQRHALLPRQFAHRRNALAAGQRARADRVGDAFGDLQVQGVVGVVHGPILYGSVV